jgi:hypothetical protein
MVRNISTNLLHVLFFLGIASVSRGTSNPNHEFEFPDNEDQGEHKTEGGGNKANVGVHCYSSKNLTDWIDEGIALAVIDDDENHDITKGCVLERPMVIYNEATNKYVMWFHLELKNMGYNAARTALAVADNMMGPWTSLGNPFVGSREEIKTSFRSQPTCVIPVIGKKDAFIYMGDRWTPKNAIDGRYIWLPVEFEQGRPIVKWHDQWDLSFFD